MAMGTLSLDQFNELTKRTVQATPSPYESDVQTATADNAYFVAIDEETTSRTIVNNLHKAARALGVKLQVAVREKAVSTATPLGIVVWKLADVEVESAK